ncbi:unnamed protein product [Amaranthus hypochondriacus]
MVPHVSLSYPSISETLVARDESLMVTPARRPRGRPKKANLPLRDTQSAGQILPKSHFEAVDTWNMAKTLGIKAVDEEAVITELRRSKRLMVMDEQSPNFG